MRPTRRPDLSPKRPLVAAILNGLRLAGQKWAPILNALTKGWKDGDGIYFFTFEKRKFRPPILRPGPWNQRVVPKYVGESSSGNDPLGPALEVVQFSQLDPFSHGSRNFAKTLSELREQDLTQGIFTSLFQVSSGELALIIVIVLAHRVSNAYQAGIPTAILLKPASRPEIRRQEWQRE